MKRITKIVCTLGPASNKKEIISKMMDAGMDYARLNMSHGTVDSQQKIVDELADLRRERGLKLMVDTKGPEMRIGTFKDGQIELKAGDVFTFTTNEVVGNENIVSLKYKNLVNEVKVGDKIFANNGRIVLVVGHITDTDIACKVEFGGVLSNNKGLNVPNVVPSTPYISPADEIDLKFAIKNNAELLALSFVSCVQNIRDVKEFLTQNGGKNIKLIAKIENASGVENIEEILDVCDGVMVARGDLGVEIPLEKIPPIQKKLISLCNVKRKFCIVATEMLESMISSTRPTRAEVNDVANAIYEEASATMLSGETAAGIDPVNVVVTMTRIILETEKHIYGVSVL